NLANLFIPALEEKGERVETFLTFSPLERSPHRFMFTSEGQSRGSENLSHLGYVFTLKNLSFPP
ncbi:hypothetical protein DJ527_12530, partial [Sulfolobus sp. F1]